MEKFKKICKALLFPHIAIMILLIPFATAFLVYSMVVVGTETVPAYISYVFAAYTLTIWCCKIPNIIRFFKNFKNENKYMKVWAGDVSVRVRVSLYGSFVWNAAYSIFQLCLGIYHSSVWYYALAGYYVCLALMRFFLSRHTIKHKPGENMKKEFSKYRICGWIFLVINLALSAIVFLMIYQNKSSAHHEITTISIAAYTFTTLTVAIVNTVRYRKYESPVYSASKAISLAAACVSMITLTSTMLASFGDESTNEAFRTYTLALLGAAVAVLITTMAIYMIVKSTKKLNALKAEAMNE